MKTNNGGRSGEWACPAHPAKMPDFVIPLQTAVCAEWLIDGLSNS